MINAATVYVALLDEGVDVWRPVQAEYLGADLYRLTGAPPDDEAWPFAIGDVVRCEVRTFAGGAVLVAYENRPDPDARLAGFGRSLRAPWDFVRVKRQKK
jgi:hypothetical protein